MTGELEGVVALFSAAIRDPEPPPPHDARLLVYRRLVRRGLLAGVRAQLTATAARLGGSFDTWVERWLDEELPRSHYMRDLAAELLAWAAPRWRADAVVPPWMVDFARHEAALFEVRAAPSRPAPAEPLALALDRAVLFDGPTRLARYDWAVHAIVEGPREGETPLAQPTELLLYRDAAHEARFLVLTPLAAAILERLLAREALGPAVTSACAAMGFGVEDSVLRGTAEVLADLGARGALQGAMDPKAST